MSRTDDFERFAGTSDVSGDLKRRSVLGALATGGGQVLDMVLRLGSTLVLARLLVPEQFGLVAMVTAITRIAERFTALGLSAATVQAPEINHAQCSNLFWINSLAGLLFAGAVALSAPWIAAFYEDDRLTTISVALSLSFIGAGLTIQHQALLLRQLKMAQLTGIQVVATLLSVCLAIALALAGFGYWALVWKEVAQSFFMAVGTWALCRWVPSMPSRRVEMGRLLTFGRDMTLTQFLFATAAQLDSVLIGRFGGAVPLGLYRQAYNLFMGPIERLNAPILGVSQPTLSILQFEPDRYRRYYERILLAVSLATIPLGVFTTICAREIVLVGLGEEWLGAVVYLRIFGIAGAILVPVGTSGTIQITRGQSGRYLVVNLVYSVVLVALMFVGAIWGVVAIAAARLVTLVTVSPWALHFAFKGSPVSLRDFLRTVSRPVIASLVMGASLFLLQFWGPAAGPILALIADSIVAAAAYCLAFILLPGGRQQLQSLLTEVLGVLKARASKASETG